MNAKHTALIAGVATSLLAAAPAAAEELSDRSRFVDKCLAMIDAQDESVYDLCYTSDYVLSGGPETYFAPGRKLIGRNGVRAKMVVGAGDLSSFDSIEMTWTDLAESRDTLVRHLHQDFKGPRNPNYAGFIGLPRDLAFPVDVIIVYTFRDGKIASEFFQYDSMGFLLDLGQGDPDKIAAALKAMMPLMEQMKSGAVPEGAASAPAE